MEAMRGAVGQIMAGNLPTNQRPACCGKSLEHDSMLIRSEGHLGEFKEEIPQLVIEIMTRNHV